MMSPEAAFSFIEDLDDEQRAAALAEENTVVSAGAGSGKTRVICARYGWLIMSGRCEIEQILTITFTNKAANEMYRRIYSLLSDHAPHNEYAQKALVNFHKAHISTLDSFCAGIARTVSRHFGISPDFKNDEIRIRDMARSLALRFVLDRRNNPVLQTLIVEKKITLIAEELFVRPVLKHSTISMPLNFDHFETIQREEIIQCWTNCSRRVDDQIKLIQEMHSQIPAGKSLYQHLCTVLPKMVQAPPINSIFLDGEENTIIKKKIKAYLDFLSELLNHIFRGKITDQATLLIKDAFSELKGLNVQLKALANNAFQWNMVGAVFPLINEYQEKLNQKKRETGLLTFNDIAQLAVDGLRVHEDIRTMYRESFRMIMIDEFQDNNSLQRELVELLADPANVFYVGDEKQSIYRFRGADVSVFRQLTEQTRSSLSLSRNYRSHNDLIRAFNLIFGGYCGENDQQPIDGIFPAAETENYQAVYRWTQCDENTAAQPRLHFAFFDKGSMDPDDYLKAQDHEAAYIAAAINNLIDQKRYTFNDIAVLLRSHTHQKSLERAFKQHGIPFNSGKPAALFSDAPLNDIWAFLKLLVYPKDRIAYGALLRSPFVRLSEDAFTLCMLEGEKIFDLSLDDRLPPSDCRAFQEARRSYNELLLEAQDLPVSSLITKLWYGEGYRFEALWSIISQVYLDHYDLIFEQARTIEERGGGLVEFLDYLEDLANKQEKPDDSVLPGDEESGVKIMTIHQCKGLEFPVVFLYGCGSREKASLEPGLAHFSQRRGIFLQLPQSEELPDAKDYFYLTENEEHRDKTEAELRRLLYVAMTRAEQELYISAVIPEQTKEEQKILNTEISGKEYIVQRLEQYNTKETIHSISFLRLLPNLSTANSLYTINIIDEINVSGFNMQKEKTKELSMQETALLFQKNYQLIPEVSPYQFFPQTVSVTSLTADSFEQPNTSAGIRQPDVLDVLLAQCGIEAKEFGTIVHGFIEAMFNNKKPSLPSFCAGMGEDKQKALVSAATVMAEGFIHSPLGCKALSAIFIKTEYPVFTRVEGKRQFIVSGIIDLLFDDGNVIYVVDFKTDREQDIGRHTTQLAIYKQAAEDIFDKTVECRLFYLRTGSEIDPGTELDFGREMNNILIRTG